MNKTGPIVLIEDDQDDQELLQQLFAELALPNELVLFENGQSALDYLQQPDVKPFLIISDINMPGMDGFQLRSQILSSPDMATKCIPFLFCTTGASSGIVQEAYTKSVQGIFQKPSRYDEWKNAIQAIVTYWTLAISPNRY